ncbi:hypothetical protein GCM10009862_16160 [Microbacterium binotii]|uniref:Uncharacterized protein n=1 Tax=Microbacterium binotii TaxID=462710 RepID=A0ABN3PE94_9MICO
MADPFSRAEKNMTVWQRLRAACESNLGAFTEDEIDGIVRALHPHVVRERADASAQGGAK